ncbi:TRAP transporter, DctM subunit [Paracoccus halophilus]|uniref:TRAP transporter large permease protein n=1 Tax=Paracoccus halophilus TaxID=376733 RepID=A0A099F1Y0_9RHOB|nr:TRAP transporter large permease [Paracoccus halophilus]KGJ04251.1 C4-dicarboxylate ABC transporter permease [Paracoccus halophilus]SFA52148.1 TRAP transporter, DctM subunit [Paracoccus halophilus]
MTGIAAGLTGFAVLLVLMAIRIPIGVSMLAVGIGGYGLYTGTTPLLAFLKTSTYYQFSTYSLSVIPLFVLMGEFATKAGMSRALYRTAAAFLGHRKGGLAMASIGGCAAFGAICGSSLATAATMGQVALPEMRRYNYSGALATGSLAAGGTLGILIPPSVILVLYALMAEQSIAKMFVAAMVPGVLAALGYMLAVAIFVRRNPEDGPAGPRATWPERLEALRETWSLILIFALVIVGMYRGWFTPTEAAAVGAFGTGLLAILHGGLRLQGLMACLRGTATTSAMIFLILLGAETFNAFLAQTQTPMLLANAIQQSGLTPMLVLLAMLLLYLLLGCVMDSMSMLLLTIPIFYPIIAGLDFGMPREDTLIWFGILAVVVVEVGLITPPVGMNVFVINGMAKDVPMIESFRGVLPFLISDIIRIAVLILFPVITLGLVRVFG